VRGRGREGAFGDVDAFGTILKGGSWKALVFGILALPGATGRHERKGRHGTQSEVL
jgi:hypothetical protein